MGDRIKSSLFNSLGNIQGYEVWDAFAGSGALAIESVSRGAWLAVATERDPKSYRTLKANVEKLKVTEVHAIKASAKAWSSTNVDKLSHLKPNGLMVLSYPGREPTPVVNGVVVVDNRNYGDAALASYRLL